MDAPDKIGDLAYEAIGPDHYGMNDGFRAPLPESSLTVERYGSMDILRDVRNDDVIIAINQSGMIHDTLAIFEIERSDILSRAGLPLVHYDLIDISDRTSTGLEYDFPPVAVWLRRMPGFMMTAAKLRPMHDLVQPQPGEPSWRMNDELETDDEFDDADFWHGLSYIAQDIARSPYIMVSK